jgi:hypothetical protein
MSSVPPPEVRTLLTVLLARHDQGGRGLTSRKSDVEAWLWVGIGVYWFTLAYLQEVWR